MLDAVVEHILINYRWIFVCIFLLPISVVYDIWTYFRSWIVFQLNSAPLNHNEKVGTVQAQVKYCQCFSFYNL